MLPNGLTAPPSTPLMNLFTSSFHFESTGSPIPQRRSIRLGGMPGPALPAATPTDTTVHGAPRFDAFAASHSNDASNFFVNVSGDTLDASGVREQAATLRSHGTSSPSPSSHPTETIAAALAGYVPSPEPISPATQPTNQDLDSERLENLKLWALKIGNQLGLRATQYSDLVGFVDLGENLDFGKLRILIWQQATLYQIFNAIEAMPLR
ncbi:hypothetical protein BU15DRAFT_69655, partial [Melanogaster broomeanus]